MSFFKYFCDIHTLSDKIEHTDNLYYTYDGNRDKRLADDSDSVDMAGIPDRNGDRDMADKKMATGRNGDEQ